MTLKVFVSSTSFDMTAYREKARDALLRLNDIEIVAMEYFGSHEENGRVLSVKEVARADVYVGIIGWRYGRVTKMEYDEAIRLKKDILIYLADEKAPFPSGTRDREKSDAASQQNHGRLLAFREHLLQTHTCTTFNNPDDLAARLSSDLHRILMGGPQGKLTLTRGRAALQRGDYLAALAELQQAVTILREDALPYEAATARYCLAITQLNGKRPFVQTFATMQTIDTLLRSAIQLYPCRTFCLMLALCKLDFSRNGLPRFKEEALQLIKLAKEPSLNAVSDPDPGLALLAHCQPALVRDYVTT